MKLAPVSATGLVLARLKLNKVGLPLPMVAGANDLTMVGLALMLTTSVALLLATTLAGSSLDATVAVLLRLLGAVFDTVTVITMLGALAPTAKPAPARVHVTSWATMVQDQPAPAAAVGVKPVGKVSVTVMVPPTGALPTLLADRVKLALV